MWVSGVYDIEEELPLWKIGNRPLLGEKLRQLRLRHNIFDQADDAKLIVLCYLHWSQLNSRDEMLAARKDFLEKVLRNLLDGRLVVLT